ncbi:amino acid ABC transporter substrate-binding protein [Desulfovibrio sp. JC010]|uniref:amino acid ABC transporter substrate-binding protein n=1 Tax=Desulfovibrio sp. JC010 TaxID=2593641 RepID=UPI0013D1B25E|nr:amino acid ABC transporter substrate-binding protein [Desulfovibrio sp. JC010]NDV27930.1 amino acid ABC transporter substrate-binding protein [Desulfovibrio sp. JC010]
MGLDKTIPEYGEYKLVHYHIPSEQLRSLRLIKHNKGMDVGWAETTIQREEEFQPIRIPIQKGLISHRIFIIKPENQAAFNKVKSIDDLKKYRAGQGYDWPDTEILKLNELPTTTCPQYRLCFIMLNQDRFEYFPRGVVEPWDEIRQHPEMDLTVEKKLMLRYPSPLYFFVSKNNTKLAERIEKGLMMAIEDGSFDELFYNHPQIRPALKKAKLKQRIIIDLNNPIMPPKTPLNDQRLWIDIDKIPD